MKKNYSTRLGRLLKQRYHSGTGLLITFLFFGFNPSESLAQCPVNDQTVSAAVSTFSCSGSTTIDVGSSQAGVNYYLIDNATGAVLTAPVPGTGSPVSLATGTISSTTTFDVYGANPSNAVLFNGTSQYMTVPAPTGLPAGNVITVEAWIYPISYPDATYSGIVSYGPRNCSPSGKSFLLSMTNAGRPSMATWCNDFVPNTGPTATLNAWNHIACVINGTSVKLYLNGYEWSGTLTLDPSIVSGTLNIGCTDNPGRYFNGRIDEVRIWNTARTALEINQNKLTCLTGTEPGLVSYYKFEEGAGTSVADIAGTNTGTLINAVPWVQGSDACSPCFATMLQNATVTIDDVTAPTASNPAPVSVQCFADLPAPDVNVVTDEADDCGGPVVVAFVSDVSDGNTCPEIITRTYSVTDADLNSMNVTQTITINDITNPTASNPAPVNVQCTADIPAPDVFVVTDEADNCSTPFVAFVSDVSDGLTCPETITRTYSITDDCSNQIFVTQTITVADFTDPSASNPATINVQCTADIPAPNVLVVTDEADNCSTPAVAFVSEISDGLTCPETITRTYSVTDDCGNQILVAQTIIVDDTTNPTASNPATTNVECTADIPAPDVLVVTDEADNCSIPVVAFVSDVSDGLSNPETITRTYSVTDNCGNQIFVTHLIVVDDNTAPVISNCPADISLDADAAGCSSDVLWTAPTGLDNCMGAITPSSTHNSGDNFLEGITVVIYTFDDGNGNSATCEFNVEVISAISGTSATSTDEITGNDGTIDLTVTGGTAPYTFSWTGPTGFTSTSEDLSGLAAGTYDVTVTDANGCSTTVEVIVNSQVGIEETDNFSFSIYPNPTSGLFTISVGNTDVNVIRILDATGRVVMTINDASNTTEIDLSAMQSGVYFVQIQNGTTVQNASVILQ